MIVEFAGLPGAGKTALHRRAIERLRAFDVSVWPARSVEDIHGSAAHDTLDSHLADPTLKGHSLLWSKLRKVTSLAQTIVQFRRLIGIAIWHLIKRHRTPRDKLRSLQRLRMILENQRRVRAQTVAEQIVLLDESVVHNVLNIFVDGISDIDLKAVRCYIHAIPRPHVLIYVKVDPVIAQQRCATRVRGLPKNMQAFTLERAHKAMTDSQEVLNMLVEEFQASKGTSTQVVSIDANDLARTNSEFDAHVIPYLVSMSKDLGPVTK